MTIDEAAEILTDRFPFCVYHSDQMAETKKILEQLVEDEVEKRLNSIDYIQ